MLWFTADTGESGELGEGQAKPSGTLLDSLLARHMSHLQSVTPQAVATNSGMRTQKTRSMMSNFLTSDLFRNFLGGFVIGAVALVALQPREADALPQATPMTIEAPLESPDA